MPADGSLRSRHRDPGDDPATWANPAASLLHAAAPDRRSPHVNRATLVKLGQAGNPEGFLTAAAAACSEPSIAADPGVRFLVAHNLADVGLTEPARRVLTTLPPEAAASPPVDRLRARLVAAHSETTPLDIRITRLEAARDLLHAGTGTDDVETAFGRALNRESGFTVHRSTRGVEVRLTRDETTPPPDLQALLAPWRPVAGLESLGTLDEPNTPPITIESLDDPRLVTELAARTPPHASGFHRGLYVIEPDPERVLGAAVAHPGLIDVLAQERTRLFTGTDAAERLAAFLSNRQTVSAIGPWFGRPTAAAAVGVLRRATAERDALAVRTRATIAARDADRTPETAADRFARRAGSGGLRVLIPTCRFSTYVRHSSESLARAFRRAGHSAEVLIEPDASTNLLDVAYLDACARCDPDLIVLINYPRATRASCFPRAVAFVCWVQDHMPHLYDPAVARAQGPLDLLAGHTPLELFSRIGYDPARALGSPVAVNGETFHPGPVDAAHAERFSCDIAYVSHQSEPFDAMVRRLTEEAGPAGEIIRALEPIVRAAVDDLAVDPIVPRLRTAVDELLGAHPSLDAPANRARFVQSAALPMAERLIRHRVLSWAGDLADEDGLDLRIFGNGWETHPTLARFAAGGVEHGEELRACHASAALQLHPTVQAATHQRVLECALSGGFPLISFHASALPSPAGVAALCALDPADARPGARPGTLAFDRSGHAGLEADAARRRRLGLPSGDVFEIEVDLLERVCTTPRPEGVDIAHPSMLFPDLRPFVFLDRDDFRARVRTLLADRGERARWSAALAERAAEGYTLDAFVRRLVGFVGRKLPTSGGRVADSPLLAS